MDGSNSNADGAQRMVYQIRVEGHLDREWADWFGSLSIRLEDNGETLITGRLADQSALFGVLKKIQNLGMSLISVNALDGGQPCKAIEQEQQMNEKSTLATAQAEKWLYRLGGVSALVLVVGYLLTFPIYAWVGDAPPSDVEAQLVYFSQHGAGWWAILGLMVFTDLLYIPVFMAVYQALKAVNRNIMILACAMIGLFIVLDLSLTWTSYSSLIMSGNLYASAADETQKAALIAGAGYPSTMLDSPLLGAYAILIPSLGFLFTGLVMRTGTFGKAAAYLALAVGVTGIVFIGSYFWEPLAIFRIINALLATGWYMTAGWQLYRLGR